MGHLTDDMNRLYSQIDGMRRGRQLLMRDLARSTALRRADVSKMLVDFSKAQAQQARKMRADLSACMGGVQQAIRTLQRGVTDQRAEFIGELADARQAWIGLEEVEAEEMEEGVGAEGTGAAQAQRRRTKKRKR